MADRSSVLTPQVLRDFQASAKVTLTEIARLSEVSHRRLWRWSVFDAKLSGDESRRVDSTLELLGRARTEP